MKKYTLVLLILLFTPLCFSQNNLSWKGYFSFNDIKDVSQSADKLYAASENAIFSKNLATNIIQSKNTIDGLSGETISTIYYSSENKKTLIGYENGLIIVINEIDGKMLNVVDIINKSIPANTKKVNHFMEYENIVYISCDFGIVQYNLKTLQFGDTYFIGDGGALISISQTAVFQGNIYASTVNNGIRRALITNKNLNDYSQWTNIAGGGWLGITNFKNNLFATTNNGIIQELKGNTFTTIITLPEVSVDFRSNEEHLVITTANHVYLYSNAMVKIADIKKNDIPEINSRFTCATTIGETIFIGTFENGLINTKISGNSSFENDTPSGPLRNSIFSLQTASDFLWAVYGDYSSNYNPYPLDNYGISKFSNSGWLNIPYEEVLGAKSISRVIINPIKKSEVYMGSSYSGILKIENDIPTVVYNAKNTGANGLQSIKGEVPDDVRVNGGAFDKSGNLWVNNSLVEKGLVVMKATGQWQNFSLNTILDKSTDTSMGRMVIDDNSTKWWCTNTDGLISYNESTNKFKKITFGSEKGNLPSKDVRAIAIDNRNQLWIGTTKGLRVLSNVNSFLTEDQMTSSPIIILEDNLAQELLYEQSITDIAVDGANNKWIATADSGLFFVAPNGQETKYHFTVKNSPLPSNTINDIEIDSKTGEVFIATNKGMISFKGIATKANEDLSNVYVYPNPVRPEYQGTVKIAGLIDKANIKITDIEGNLVYETTATGGTIEWDITAFGKYKLSSGVYMIFISAQDGVETKVKKVMIIR